MNSINNFHHIKLLVAAISFAIFAACSGTNGTEATQGLETPSNGNLVCSEIRDVTSEQESLATTPPTLLKICAKLETSVFNPGEPVNVDATITNVSGNDITLGVSASGGFHPTSRQAQILVTSESGDQIALLSDHFGAMTGYELAADTQINERFAWDQRTDGGNQAPHEVYHLIARYTVILYPFTATERQVVGETPSLDITLTNAD